MTEEGLNRIAGGLGITLPTTYRDLMLKRGDEFRTSSVGHWLWASANQVIIKNLEERDKRGGTAGAYPNWWHEYLLIGDNGDCEFFCLRLDSDTAVYKISADDNGPEKVAKSLSGYLNTKWVKPLLKARPKPPTPAKLPCPCCGFLTIFPFVGDTCSVCGWDVDLRPNATFSANEGVSLAKARANYKAFGVFSKKYQGEVRAPKPEEMPG